MPISAVDAITPAFQHARQQLLQPFRAGQWAKLGLVGLLAGEMSSAGGGCNPGSVSPTFLQAVLSRTNYFRAMAGIPTVTFNGTDLLKLPSEALPAVRGKAVKMVSQLLGTI